MVRLYGPTFSHPWEPTRPTTVRTSSTLVHVGNRFVEALFQPPTPVYNQKDLLDYTEVYVAELGRDFPATSTVLAGNLNQLMDQDLEEQTGLTQIVQQRIRGDNILDRVYISHPQLYSIVRVVASVKSDHRAVIVYVDQTPRAQKTKKTFYRTFWLKTQKLKLHLLDLLWICFTNPQQIHNFSTVLAAHCYLATRESQ
jgi:hypothetical protein